VGIPAVRMSEGRRQVELRGASVKHAQPALARFSTAWYSTGMASAG
jgi:hypothetical protein